ncbi:creatininase [Halocalculus aciditolerans]|uniref:Creatininase n=2 Tax=Halocalculus aciditolerans TaxID=1383812 RepID=A0A830F403_9EURY|nr:creatininase [Halocalculus aciditolerans]
MTWPDVEDALDDSRLVVVPTASIEQHGPHLPLAVDTIRANVLGRRIADRLDCFVAPTVRPGRSDHHMAFPGTITLRPETFRGVLRDYAASLADHGFEHVAYFTSHGGNTDLLDDAVPDIAADVGVNAFVAGTRDGITGTRERAMASFDVPPAEAGAHAGAAETAFIMQTDPELVQDTTDTTGFLGEFTGKDIAAGIDTLAPNGVLGDPERASVEQGETIIRETADYLADEIRAELGVTA